MSRCAVPAGKCPKPPDFATHKIILDKNIIDAIIITVLDAALAHPVERHLAKVEVASSSLVSRSIFFNCCILLLHYAVF